MKVILFLVLIQISIAVALGQDTVSDKVPEIRPRPKIGLVLSGGGARGFAHVGVLKVLEENRIPIDYISGASMGALVGSLYATGHSTAEMELLVKTLDWRKLLDGGPPYQKLTYRRKQDSRNIPGGLSLRGQSVKSLEVPSSINPGHEVGLAIDRLFLNYSSVDNFDELPIPFRAVATDMLNAETVVLKGGSLQQSLRATMAIPAVFAPVEINGRILADGGILNNIPTDVVKDMGADIIIVVNIETQIGDRASLDNLIGVLGQTFIVATVENSRRGLREADLIIAPDLGKYSSSNFEDGKEIIRLGYEGASSKTALLKSLSLPENEWQVYLAERQSRQLPETTPIIDFLQVEGTESTKSRAVITNSVGENTIHKSINQTEVENDLTKLTGTRRFQSLGYELTETNGRKGLLIRVYDSVSNNKRNTNLELGVDVNNTEAETANFSARGRLTIYDIGSFGSEWRNDFSIGSQTLFSTEYFRPISNSRFFVAPNALFQSRKVGFYEDGERLAEYSFETAKIGLDIGYSIDRKSEVRIGYQFGHQKISRQIGDPLLPELSGRISVASLTYNFDGADSAQIPTRGLRFSSTLNYFLDSPGTSYGIPQAETQFQALHPVNDKYIAFGFGGAGTSFGRFVAPTQQYTLGGLFNVGGYGSEEFRGSNFARGGIGVLRETYALPSLIGGKLYLGAWYEAGSAFEKLDTARYRQSITGGVLTETPFGPIFIGGSLADGGRRKIYFSLGRFF